MKANQKTTLDECPFAEMLTDESAKLLATMPASWPGLYVRAIRDAIDGKPLLLRRIRIATGIEPPFPPEISVRETQISAPAGTMRLRIYSPKNPSENAAIFYVHGGGWCLGGVENASAFCASLASSLGVPVIVPDYRFAPEFRFPAANEDVLAAARRVLAGTEIAEFGVPERVFFAGDSAGAQLALCTALRLLDCGEKMPAGQILFYPVATLADFPENPTGTLLEFDRGGLLSLELFAAMKDSYVPAGTPRNLREISPLETTLAGLPRTFVFTAECDILRDDGERLAEKMRAEGVLVRSRRVPGVPHAFLTAPGFPKATAGVLAEVADFIRA